MKPQAYEVGIDQTEMSCELDAYSLRQNRSLSQILVWDAAMVRFVLEGVTILLSFQVITNFFVPNNYKNLLVSDLGLLAGIAAIVIFFDRVIICRGLIHLETSYQKAFEGNIREAIKLLKNSKESIVPIPKEIFIQKNIELQLMNNRDEDLKSLIKDSKEVGISKFEVEFLKYRGILFSTWRHEGYENIIDKELETHAEALIQIERAMISLFREDNPSTAIKLSNLVSHLPNKIHVSGASTFELAHLINLCAGLKQGKAETSLTQLSILLDFIKFQIAQSPNLRPYLAFAYLERAKYYSRRNKTKNKSHDDIKMALSICNYPAHQEIAAKIKEI